ncbi:unnamed protein product [Rhizophagus irregularis]|nr:unnamed protein product [Rhizophagus irregularis]CAB5389597.1 unnamed protein product [Rhizophagus irregularis]
MSYSIQIKKAILTKNDSFNDFGYLDFDDEKYFDASYLEFDDDELYNQEITYSKLKSGSHQAKSAQIRQQVRTRLAELKGVDPNSIPYPRSNDKLSEYERKIQHLEEKLVFSQISSAKQVHYPRSSFSLLEHNDLEKKSGQARSAELRQQVRNRLAELKGVDPSLIPYPRSNIKLQDYEDEILRLEIAGREFQKKLQFEKLAKKSKELKEREDNSYNSLKKYGIDDSRITTKTANKFSDSNKEQSQNKADNLRTIVFDRDEAKYYRKIAAKSDVKTRKLIKNPHLAIVDISYREDKDGKSTFWDHYTFQRITRYPTRVVGTPNTDNAKLLKRAIYNNANGLPISHCDPYDFKPTPPILNLYPYPSDDLHGLLLIPGSHSDISKIPNYEVRLKNDRKLVKDALNRGRPVLGICAGALEIWKLYGGKEVAVHHHSWKKMPRLTEKGRFGDNVIMHSLRIYSGSILADAMYEKAINKQKTFVTNSVHTKAMSPSIIPPNMKIVARSLQCDGAPTNRSPEDNVIEAVEMCHGAPMLLIQWHPEAFNADDTDGIYHRNILTYMAKAGDAYYWKQKMLLELKEQFQFKYKSSRFSGRSINNHFLYYL